MRDSENDEKLPSPARGSARKIDEIKNKKSTEKASKNRSPRGNKPREVFPERTQESNQLTPDRQIPLDLASGSDSSTEFLWGELVIFNNTTAGVVIDHVGDFYKVLDTRGHVHKNLIKDLKRPNPELKYHAFDCNGEEIKCKSIVKIVQGRYRDKCGDVLHIYKNYVYFFSREMRINEGIVVMEANQLELVNGKHKITSPSDMSDSLSSISIIKSPTVTYATVLTIETDSPEDETGRHSVASNTVSAYSPTSQDSSSAPILNTTLDTPTLNTEPYSPKYSNVQYQFQVPTELPEIINFYTVEDSNAPSDNSSRSQNIENTPRTPTENYYGSETIHGQPGNSQQNTFAGGFPNVAFVATNIDTSQCHVEPIMTTAPIEPQNPTPPDINETPLTAGFQQSASESSSTNYDWQQTGTVVHIKPSYYDEDVCGKTGVISLIAGEWCVLRLNKDNRMVAVDRSAVERVVPERGDRVRITNGRECGLVGKVLNCKDETELCVVAIELPLIMIVSRKDLCKMSRKP